MENAERINRYGAKDVIEKKVSVWTVVGMIYAMCCAGAFGIEEMIPEGGPGLTLAMLIVLPLVWALPYSFICAELGSARPVEGGKLMWVKEALGEFWFGIMVLVNFFWGLIANTVYVVLAVNYLGSQIELSSMQAYILKVGLIFIFFVVNVLGIKEVGSVSTFISVAVFSVFLLVTVVGFSNASQNPFEPFINPWYDTPIMAFGACLGVGLWMYSGFDEISLIGGEIKGAEKVIPRALIIVIPLIALTYVLPTMAGLSSIGGWDAWTTEPGGFGYHSVMELSPIAPGFLAVLFIVVAILGQCAIYNVCILAASRSAMILSDESFGPKSFAKLSSKRGMPVVALVVVGIVTAALLGTPNNQMEFTFLVLVDAFFGVVVVALVVVSAIVLRRRLPDEEFPFKAPGGRMGHNIMVCLCLIFCIGFALLNGIDYFLGGYIIMILLPAIYVLCKLTWKGATVKEPDVYPIDTRTKLGFGDLSRMGGYYLGFGLFGLFSRFFFVWYEEEELASYWAAGRDFTWYEAEQLTLMYGEGNPHGYTTDDIRIADLAAHPELAAEGASQGDFWIPGWYEYLYGTGLFSDFYAMVDAVTYIAIGAAALGVILLLAGRKLRIES